ncbi:hypothetical protein MSAN_02412800 [Mycena sanguinolenta]|uniref:Uncharacterized protein n=1 Tax=Mycena sanguinolenta TaxID=230812 RepID=A0A8H6X3P5_9AGAR|nr:hypothetical protein MSAN_02412800 [Mycena sanguinolenta]
MVETVRVEAKTPSAPPMRSGYSELSGRSSSSFGTSNTPLRLPIPCRRAYRAVVPLTHPQYAGVFFRLPFASPPAYATLRLHPSSTAARTRAATFSRFRGAILVSDAPRQGRASREPSTLVSIKRTVRACPSTTHVRGAIDLSEGGRGPEEAKALRYHVDTTSFAMGPRAGPMNNRRAHRSVLLPASTSTSAARLDPAPERSSTTCGTRTYDPPSAGISKPLHPLRGAVPLSLDIADVYLHRLGLLSVTITPLHLVVFHSVMPLPP